MLPYEFTERAVLDIEAARRWYDRYGVDLGNRFADDVLAAIRIARERPESCPEVEDGARTLRCQRFPYRVYFDRLTDRIRVLAVYHLARDPGRWNDPTRE